VLAAIAVEPVERPDLAVLAALLHDTVEDTHVTVESIAAIFGAPVARAVAALTKDSSLPAEERMSDSLRRILAEPPEVAMVKLADRIVNLAEPPPTWSYEKRSAYQREARSIAATLGHVSATLDARLRAKIDAYDRFVLARGT
jgi:(p)ppGpp synthase/HD superfamily hydrolase